MKYIMFQDCNGRKIPIIFPKNLVHQEVAEALEDLVVGSAGRIVSAGEISFEVIRCFGKSETLEIGVIKGDAKLIDEYDYFFGLPNETGISIKELREKFRKEN